MILVASGSGTDARAIMSAWQEGKIPNVDLKCLISTKEGAGCLEKAEELGVPSRSFHYYGRDGYSYSLNKFLREAFLAERAELVFLVGCIAKVELVTGVKFYNIHPASLELAGGKGMYGLEPHKKVLINIQDLVGRGRKAANDRFFTFPTVHEVSEVFDSGPELMRVNVEIPPDIITRLIRGTSSLEDCAAELQKHVLPCEWQMLPWAVSLAASKILASKETNHKI